MSNFFKNITVLQLEQPLDATALDEAMQAHLARDCGAIEEMTQGWDTRRDQLIVSFQDGFAFRLQQQKKLMPAASLKRLLANKVQVLELEQDRKIPKKERTQLMDEIIVEKLPTAFVAVSHIDAYFDAKHNWLVIDAVGSKAEEFASYLRKTLGSLKTTPIHTDEPFVMGRLTDWVQGLGLPDAIKVQSDIDLADIEGKSTIKLRNADIDSQLPDLISQGYKAKLVGLGIDGDASFQLTPKLELKKFRIDDLQANAGTDYENPLMELQTDLLIQAGVVRNVMQALLAATAP